MAYRVSEEASYVTGQVIIYIDGGYGLVGAGKESVMSERTTEVMVKPGMRLKCSSCGTEVVVIKPDGAVPECCGSALETPPKKG